MLQRKRAVLVHIRARGVQLVGIRDAEGEGGGGGDDVGGVGRVRGAARTKAKFAVRLT